MTIKHFNYKDNVRIPESRIVIRTYLDTDGDVVFKLDELTIEDPSEDSKNKHAFSRGRVTIRARDKSGDAYFLEDLGSVDEIKSTKTFREYKMEGFRDLGSVVFNIRVLGPGKLVMAHADGIVADNTKPENKDELFQTEVRDLGETICKVEWSESMPTIVFDEAFYSAHSKSPVLNAIAIPLIQTIIPRVVRDLADDGESEFASRVVEFGEGLVGKMPDLNADGASDEIEDWAARIAHKLSHRHSVKTKLLATFEGRS
jgi:hypothetical protein